MPAVGERERDLIAAASGKCNAGKADPAAVDSPGHPFDAAVGVNIDTGGMFVMVEVEHQLFVWAAISWERGCGATLGSVPDQSLDVTHAIVDDDGRRAVAAPVGPPAVGEHKVCDVAKENGRGTLALGSIGALTLVHAPL